MCKVDIWFIITWCSSVIFVIASQFYNSFAPILQTQNLSDGIQWERHQRGLTNTAWTPATFIYYLPVKMLIFRHTVVCKIETTFPQLRKMLNGASSMRADESQIDFMNPLNVWAPRSKWAFFNYTAPSFYFYQKMCSHPCKISSGKFTVSTKVGLPSSDSTEEQLQFFFPFDDFLALVLVFANLG